MMFAATMPSAEDGAERMGTVLDDLHDDGVTTKDGTRHSPGHRYSKTICDAESCAILLLSLPNTQQTQGFPFKLDPKRFND